MNHRVIGENDKQPSKKDHNKKKRNLKPLHCDQIAVWFLIKRPQCLINIELCIDNENVKVFYLAVCGCYLRPAQVFCIVGIMVSAKVSLWKTTIQQQYCDV